MQGPSGRAKCRLSNQIFITPLLHTDINALLRGKEIYRVAPSGLGAATSELKLIVGLLVKLEGG